jgi:hypothetical protein
LSQQCQVNLGIQAKDGQEQISEANFVFSGGAFVQNPSLIPLVAGLYLGDTVENAVAKIERLFSQKSIS